MIQQLVENFLITDYEKKDDNVSENLQRLRELTEELEGTEPEGDLPSEVQEWVDKKNGS